MNFEKARQNLRESDGILQMDLSDLYSLFVQYRTVAGLQDQDGKHLEEFILVIKELLNEMVVNP
jgi:hypothetical protein